MDLGLQGRCALVMGATRGLGRAIAQTLVDEGMAVAIAARDRDVLARTAQQLGARPYAADFNRPQAVRELVRDVHADLGPLDLLVVNSGGPPKGSALDATAADWRAAFEQVWLPATEAIAAALPGMIERRRGRIVIVTSVAAVEPEPGLVYSNSLRPGLHGLVNALSRDVAHAGVTVNAVMPGYMNTQRVADIGADFEAMQRRIPAARYGNPDELAALVAFLASARAGYITGQAIACDGGLLKSI
ncbi:MAG: SDR family oxidoreductase [Proteobacteria bacterium]|nr:SDR family oxidoreductase [Pseudomonadota bacterium]